MAHEILIGANGRVRTIYSDEIKPVLSALGPLHIARASNVEPTSDGRWYAEMRGGDGGHSAPSDPCTGAKRFLGPFETRAEALAAEHQWLIDHGIPVPREGK